MYRRLFLCSKVNESFRVKQEEKQKAKRLFYVGMYMSVFSDIDVSIIRSASDERKDLLMR